jgi:hypothetical protein
MDYEKRFNQIKDFLIEHEYLHSTEMMERYPHQLTAPYDSWVKEILAFDFKQLLDFEKHYSIKNLINEELIHFIKTCEELCDIPFLKVDEEKIDGALKRKLTPKKNHEIQTIKSYMRTQNDIDTLVDIGSGAGHLSCALVAGTHLKSYCLDMNKDFQEQGQKKIDYWLPKLRDKIKFIPHKLEANKVYPFDINQDSTMTIGLHSCGPLSTFVVESKPKHLINFSCCYHKLTNEYNISQIAQSNPLTFTNHALTMAAKCLGTNTEKDLETKFLVKRFRYPLHFYQVDHEEIKFQNTGNAKASDYQGSFKDYIAKYCPDIKDHDVPLKEAETNYYLKAGSIRALLGRLIEIYIILDRVLYLRENQIRAEAYQVFDPELSPRNIGIFV